MSDKPIALVAGDAAPRAIQTTYPEPYASKMRARIKRPLGDLFGLRNFGVNLTRLQPGGLSALHHRHSRQDEFVYILEGHPTLITDAGEIVLAPGMCAGFPASGTAHHLHNRTDEDAVFLEIGDRPQDDEVVYPHDDIVATFGEDGTWRYTRKDGSPF
ncbi:MULTISPECIES: cupin domain-containing protein [Rhodomicrobium]|uniref:cupin domain-containing protein n=1 Tax=Rhodomicrobium TaxID=1068 RepID=UPI000B4AF010|nr:MULTISPECIES: cupin domain-containing protein [Rhodomicrobium]